jgi:hypothetical protein
MGAAMYVIRRLRGGRIRFSPSEGVLKDLVCTYGGKNCGSHEGCRAHDVCYTQHPFDTWAAWIAGNGPQPDTLRFSQLPEAEVSDQVVPNPDRDLTGTSRSGP